MEKNLDANNIQEAVPLEKLLEAFPYSNVKFSLTGQIIQRKLPSLARSCPYFRGVRGSATKDE